VSWYTAADWDTAGNPAGNADEGRWNE